MQRLLRCIWNDDDEKQENKIVENFVNVIKSRHGCALCVFVKRTISTQIEIQKQSFFIGSNEENVLKTWNSSLCCL